MIGQEIGLRFLMPRAIDVVKNNPLAEGDFYPGDLLQSILKTKLIFWQKQPELWAEISMMIADSRSKLEDAGIKVSVPPDVPDSL